MVAGASGDCRNSDRLSPRRRGSRKSRRTSPAAPLAALASSVYAWIDEIGAPGAAFRRGMRQRGDDPMRWLTAILALLLLGLVAFPAVESVGAWLAPRSDSVQSINYLSREIHEWSASRRATRHRDLEVVPGD